MANPGALRRFDITRIESARENAAALAAASGATLASARAVAGDDVLAVEEPLEIRVGGRSVAVVMRTPGHDRELAAGFLVTEGIVRRREELLDLVPCREGTRRAAAVPEASEAGVGARAEADVASARVVEAGEGPACARADAEAAGAGAESRRAAAGVMAVSEAGGAGTEAGRWENVLDAVLAPGVAVDWARLTRHVFTGSSCGVCGKATIDAVRTQFPAIASAAGACSPGAPGEARATGGRVSAAVLATLPAKLRAAQPGFDATGGLHASALFTAAGELACVREDVGRHNALDKVVGQAFLAERLPLAGSVLLVSGRVSFELMQKALAAGIPCVAAISAPTSLAVEFARESGQTLVGFLRDGRMNVYAGTLADA